MADLDRHELQALWKQLAQLNDWKLVEDEAAFLDSVATEWHRLQAEGAEDGSLRVAIWRTYSLLRYQRFCERNNQAAEELRIIAFRFALRRHWSTHDAEDLAQETTERMYLQRHRVDEPERLSTWMYRVFQTVQRDFIRQRRLEVPMPSTPEGEQRDLPDDMQLSDAVEQTILSDTIKAHILAAIPNALERTVLLRILFWKERPCDVARDLGLDMAYTRVLKRRARKRLEKDERFITLVRELMSGSNLEVSTTGDDGDEA